MIISEHSVRRPVFATVLSALLVLLGLAALGSLPVRQYPDIELPVVSIETSYRGRLAEVFTTPMASKLLWDLVNGDPDETWLLFVFTGPGRMAGTSLLIRDVARPGSAPPDIGDAMWFYLNAFRNFDRLGAGAERSVVPATSLSNLPGR